MSQHQPNWNNMPFSKDEWESANFDERRGMLKKVVAKACKTIRKIVSENQVNNVSEKDVSHFVEQMMHR